MSNRLINEMSPYLLQHAENPVDWYPWCDEAFEKARSEDKPIFLSIGYSTCHWCHVMAHESFEDKEVADILNKDFISVKVDREERPDIDNVYMAVCQAFTGSGGWPTTIFMTADQKPFFAGTYFPKNRKHGVVGFTELLATIRKKWKEDRNTLLKQAEDAVRYLNQKEPKGESLDFPQLLDTAVSLYKKSYDKENGGFGRAPKFPMGHNLLFLLKYFQCYGDKQCLEMSDRTLLQMHRGGIFDHIGFGFSRYSTDKKWLVPHFEKMLYDNALLIMAYCQAHISTNDAELFIDVAEKTAQYVLREMTSPQGGFYSAQDADSEGEEGKFYVFTQGEVLDVLGKKEGELFNAHFGIKKDGNFEGKNIPNLLNSDPKEKYFDRLLPKLSEYRRKRYELHLDDKILTSWNGLMIGALCRLYGVTNKKEYLDAAQKADTFIKSNLCDGDILFAAYRKSKRGVKGFIDDYGAYILAQLELYEVTEDEKYLSQAKAFTDKVIETFKDSDGGFYFYGNDSEKLILRSKETYDGALPSGNSMMAYNLVKLVRYTEDEKYEREAYEQLEFMAEAVGKFPYNHGMFLLAVIEYLNMN